MGSRISVNFHQALPGLASPPESSVLCRDSAKGSDLATVSPVMSPAMAMDSEPQERMDFRDSPDTPHYTMESHLDSACRKSEGIHRVQHQESRQHLPLSHTRLTE